MGKNSFKAVAANAKHPDWKRLTQRESALYSREDDIRSEFTRDYTRILHSLAYRRLKHKTQVFFNIEDDHVCTRMEHVTHVGSVSGSIAKYLGLNDELTRAISIGHDLGHAPFGHHGENVIKRLADENLHQPFWHEKNGLRFVDDVELLEDNNSISRNLDLTYAVRDGIISHCGEVDENGLYPRGEWIDLEKEYTCPHQYQSITWEGCVVKISDKIAYIGRDIEDAKRLGFLSMEDLSRLERLARKYGLRTLNTTVIMHDMMIDICKNSSPDAGIRLSQNAMNQLIAIKRFNYTCIYGNSRLEPFKEYADLVLTQIFNVLYPAGMQGKQTTFLALEKLEKQYPTLIRSYMTWLARYCEMDVLPEEYKIISSKCENKKIYSRLESEELYVQAILDYISGMTDRFAIRVFNELISF